jgi:hypothetical protein
MTNKKEKEPSLILSPKYGVNPTLPVCFFCLNETGEVALLGKLPEDAEAPKHSIISMEPCADCKKQMETHVCFVEADVIDNKPVRLHGYIFIPEDKVEHMTSDPIAIESTLKRRYALIRSEQWKQTFNKIKPTIEA